MKLVLTQLVRVNTCKVTTIQKTGTGFTLGCSLSQGKFVSEAAWLPQFMGEALENSMLFHVLRLIA
jgi:hypothetical protein